MAEETAERANWLTWIGLSKRKGRIVGGARVDGSGEGKAKKKRHRQLFDAHREGQERTHTPLSISRHSSRGFFVIGSLATTR
jgi:hypothetical protein